MMTVFRFRRAFTLIELLVVIAIIAILAAILFPVFSRAKEAAVKTKALSQMKQLGLSVMMYAEAYDDYFVPSTNYVVDTANPERIWPPLLLPYVKNKEIFIAPAATNSVFPSDWSQRGYGSIGMNGATAFDPAGCVEGQANVYGCEAFTTAASMNKMEEATRTGLFATTPNGELADKYRGYTFSPYNGQTLSPDARLSPPLCSDRDLVRELGGTLSPAQLKPIYARYGKTGNDDGTTPVIFGDGHAKVYSAKAIKNGGSQIIWRFR